MTPARLLRPSYTTRRSGNQPGSRLAQAGSAVCVTMAANRPPDALVAAALGLYAVWVARRTAAWLVAGGIVPLALVAVYNLGLSGSFAGGYGAVSPEPRTQDHCEAAARS